MQSITDLEEILRFGDNPQSWAHDPSKYIKVKGGRTWILTNVVFMSDWVPGFWEEVALAGVPNNFSVNFYPHLDNNDGHWTAYRRGNRIEIMTDYATTHGVDITVSAEFPVAEIRKRTYTTGEWSDEVVLDASLQGRLDGDWSVFSLPSENLQPKDLLIVTLFRRPSRPGPLHYNNILDRRWLWNYSLSWRSASSETPFRYELQESNTAYFTNMTPYEELPSTTQRRSYTQKPDGTYYYRLRACNEFGCSDYTDVVSVEVRMQPSAPSSLSITHTGANSYVLSWGEAAGFVSGYELYEATLPDFSNQLLAEHANPNLTNGILTGLLNSFNASLNPRSFAVSNKALGTYYYRVRAKNDQHDGPYTVLSIGGQLLPVVVQGSTGSTVAITLQALVPPAFLNAPSTATDDYRVTWGVVPQATSYVLEKSDTVNFSTYDTISPGPGIPVDSTTLAYDVQERGPSGARLPAGTVRVSYFRVKACQTGVCTAYTAGANPVMVQVP